MIKLTLQHDHSPQVKTFFKKSVSIGSVDEKNADLALESEDHFLVLIHEMEDRFVIVNEANDPFTTLNGLPFSKKTIKNSDRIEIGPLKIIFEGSLTPASQPVEQGKDEKVKLLDTETELVTLVNTLIERKKEQAVLEQHHAEKSIKGEEYWSLPENFSTEEIIDLEAEMQEIEELAASYHEEFNGSMFEGTLQVEENSFVPYPEPSIIEEGGQQTSFESKGPHESIAKTVEAYSINLSGCKPKATLKDLYFTEAEQKAWENEKRQTESVAQDASVNWKLFLVILLGLLLLTTLFLGGLYFSATGKSDEEEIKAARAVSDISMALTYAQSNNIRPQKLNWTDIEFLKNNLNSVLSSKYSPHAQVDANGQLLNTPYLVRIYTSNDFSHFLVIAQPAPTVLQWLIPKASIVVDSKNMQLRKITDLKTLNRLLVNFNSSEEYDSGDISQLISEGELIPLKTLSRNNSKMGFTPPKALALIRPGSENLIYNAPRYYLFGERILTKAMKLVESQGSSKEVEMLRDDVEVMSKFENLVIYSSKGVQIALNAQRALAAFLPDKKFMIAYLKFNHENNMISSHLIMENEPSQADHKQLAYNDGNDYAGLGGNYAKSGDDTREQNSHPLYLQIKALIKDRLLELKPIEHEIISLIHSQTMEISPAFYATIQNYINRYESVDKVHQEKMVKTLVQLYQDYSEMPLSQFLEYIRLAGLEQFVRDYLNTRSRNTDEIYLVFQEQMDRKFDRISRAGSLQELNLMTKDAASLMNLEQLPNIDRLIALQAQLRDIVLWRIDKLILAPKSETEGSPLSVQRDQLIQVLKSIWINQPEVYDFYLSELDLKVQEKEKESEAPPSN